MLASHLKSGWQYNNSFPDTPVFFYTISISLLKAQKKIWGEEISKKKNLKFQDVHPPKMSFTQGSKSPRLTFSAKSCKIPA